MDQFFFLTYKERDYIFLSYNYIKRILKLGQSNKERRVKAGISNNWESPHPAQLDFPSLYLHLL